MFGKLVGAMVGERIAQNVSGLDGTEGVVLGTVAAVILRRLGPVGLIAAAAGSYALKKYYDKKYPRTPDAPT